MVTMAQRIEELRTKKGISRPALAAALGLPRLSVEKFETGRQTPTQEQQQKLAAAFGVSLSYLRGETDDPTSMDNWLTGSAAPCRRRSLSASPRRSGGPPQPLWRSPVTMVKMMAAPYSARC